MQTPKRGGIGPPGQYSVRELPVLHYKSIPEIDVSKWRLRISGLVEEERTMSYQEILSPPPS